MVTIPWVDRMNQSPLYHVNCTLDPLLAGVGPIPANGNVMICATAFATVIMLFETDVKTEAIEPVLPTHTKFSNWPSYVPDANVPVTPAPIKYVVVRGAVSDILVDIRAEGTVSAWYGVWNT